MENARRTDKHLNQDDVEGITGGLYWPEQRFSRHWLDMAEMEAETRRRPHLELTPREFVRIHSLLIARCIGVLVMLGFALLSLLGS
jgi:hypothetical protein